MGIRDRIAEIIETGSRAERKAMCEALLAELRIEGETATPVIRIPLSRQDTPSILQAEARTTDQKAVRACPPSVDRRLQHTNRVPNVDRRRLGRAQWSAGAP
jgi:hypothetical protein